MNQPVNKPIVDFIKDFNLLNENSLMHFEARVLNMVGGVPHVYNCEVGIVTIKAKQLDAIYLLNSQISEDGFEDMFPIKHSHSEYVPNKYLQVISDDRDVSIYVFPTRGVQNADKIIKELTAASM